MARVVTLAVVAVILAVLVGSRRRRRSLSCRSYPTAVIVVPDQEPRRGAAPHRARGGRSRHRPRYAPLRMAPEPARAPAAAAIADPAALAARKHALSRCRNHIRPLRRVCAGAAAHAVRMIEELAADGVTKDRNKPMWKPCRSARHGSGSLPLNTQLADDRLKRAHRLDGGTAFGSYRWHESPLPQRRAFRDRARAGATGSTSAARRARSRSRSAMTLPELLARILAGRGVELEAAARYLDPTVRALMPDPDVLAGMAAAAARLADAVQRGETVAIFGDYDVDGATCGRHARALPASWRRSRRSSISRTACSKATAPTSRRSRALAERRRDAARHRRLRHHQPRAAGARRARSAST